MQRIESLFNLDGEHPMLDSETIHTLVREAHPVDYRMLKSYVVKAPSARYVREVQIPSLRLRHPAIWQRVDSQHFTAN
jgi:hypothetical protein